MIPFGGKTITLYNRHETKGENGRTIVRWQRIVLAGCSWTIKRHQVWDGTAVRLHNEITCRIAKDTRYVPPGIWDALTDTHGRFTLAPNDVVVHGRVDEDVTPDTTIDALLSKYRRRGAMRVQYARENTDAPLAHYIAKGA